MAYNIDNLILWSSQCQAGLKDGRYVAARPVPFYNIWMRLKDAWGVLTYKYDAIEWTEQRH